MASFTKLFVRVPKAIAKFTVLSFLTLMIFSIMDCTNFVMQSRIDLGGSAHRSMNDCITSKDCGMDINEHLNVWQGMITTNAGVNFFSLFAAFLFAIIILHVSKLFSISHNSLFLSHYLYYDRDHRESKLYNYFVSIFSSGILQPKLFA